MAKREVEQAVTTDPARAKLEEIAAEQRSKEVREETPAESSARFAAEVRARMASQGQKGGAPSKRALLPPRIQPAQAQWRIWDVIPEFGTTVDHLLDPAYWAHVAKQLNPWDEIVVRSEEGSYLAKFIVLEKGNLYARIKLLPGYPLALQVSEPDVDTAVPTGYAIKWNGPHEKYAVIRGADKLRANFASKGAASEWLRDHLRVMAA